MTYYKIYNNLNKYLYDGWNLIAELDGNNALVRASMWSIRKNLSTGGLVKVKISDRIIYRLRYSSERDETHKEKISTI